MQASTAQKIKMKTEDLSKNFKHKLTKKIVKFNKKIRIKMRKKSIKIQLLLIVRKITRKPQNSSIHMK